MRWGRFVLVNLYRTLCFFIHLLTWLNTFLLTSILRSRYCVLSVCFVVGPVGHRDQHLPLFHCLRRLWFGASNMELDGTVARHRFQNLTLRRLCYPWLVGILCMKSYKHAYIYIYIHIHSVHVFPQEKVSNKFDSLRNPFFKSFFVGWIDPTKNDSDDSNVITRWWFQIVSVDLYWGHSPWNHFYLTGLWLD